MRGLTLFRASGRLALFYFCPALVLFLLLSSCSTQPGERAYTLQGQVLAVAPNRGEATIKHEDITGLMPAMTMPYKVKEAKLLDNITPGDLINATLVVVSTGLPCAPSPSSPLLHAILLPRLCLIRTVPSLSLD